MKKRFFLFAALALTALTYACEKEPDPAGPDSSNVVKVQSVAIRQEGTGSFAQEMTLNLKERQVVSLENQVTPANATEQVSYKCDNTMIARVSRKGVITARSEGSTNIHVLVGGNSMAVCHLVVEKNEVVVESFNTDVEAIEMDWGKTTHVFVNKVTPSDIAIGDTYFSFVSSNEDVFTVETEYDGFGCKVNGIAPGEATLTVSIDGLTKTIPVKIKKRLLDMRSSWVQTGPTDHYKTERTVFHEDFHAGRGYLFVGFRTHFYLVDKEGNHVHGKYGFLDHYPYSAPSSRKNAEYQVVGDSGVDVTPIRDASSRSYDGFSGYTLTFESDLYEFTDNTNIIDLHTNCTGFISFVEGDKLDILWERYNRTAIDPGNKLGNPLRETNRFYSGSFHVKVGEVIDVIVGDTVDHTNNQRGFANYVFSCPFSNRECEPWFDYSSEKGLITIIDPYPGDDMSDGNIMRLNFTVAGSDTLEVYDHFGHVRTLPITISW